MPRRALQATGYTGSIDKTSDIYDIFNYYKLYLKKSYKNITGKISWAQPKRYLASASSSLTFLLTYTHWKGVGKLHKDINNRDIQLLIIKIYIFAAIYLVPGKTIAFCLRHLAQARNSSQCPGKGDSLILPYLPLLDPLLFIS